MNSYLLSNHVYLRLTEHGAVLLDLRRDEYLNLSHEQVAALPEVVDGWPSGHPPTLSKPVGKDEDPVRNFIGALVARGLVTADKLGGKPATQADLEPAESSLDDDLTEVKSHSLGQTLTFLRACAHTSLSLRLRSLESVIRAIERRKRNRAPALPSVNTAEVRRLVATFRFLRPFVYTEHDQCLFDSLTLVNFLAAYQIFPTLVFGIRTNPFEAHAWVQEGRCALNYPAEYVRGYLPIMTV